MNIEVILFDLGGVLVEWDGVTPLVNLTNGRITPEQARRFWLESSWVKQFETGQCSDYDFSTGVIHDLGLNLTPGEFIKKFSSWDRGPFKGAPEILKRLQENYNLYCLSNSNRIHWPHPGIQALLSYFIKTFVSFETGYMKPDPRAFKWALSHIPEKTDRILFIDDNQECIKTAAELGLIARQAKGLSGIKKVLGELCRTTGVEFKSRGDGDSI